jgi:hypothetical protein
MTACLNTEMKGGREVKNRTALGVEFEQNGSGLGLAHPSLHAVCPDLANVLLIPKQKGFVQPPRSGVKTRRVSAQRQ